MDASTAWMVAWSIISSAAGTIPAAMMADTARAAASIDGKEASSVRTAAGSGVHRTVTVVATPKHPSLPTKHPSRSGPSGSPKGSPSVVTVPSGSTTSHASTWLRVTPYLRQCGPPAFSATLPPMVQAAWLEGSGAKCSPCGSR